MILITDMKRNVDRTCFSKDQSFFYLLESFIIIFLNKTGIKFAYKDNERRFA